MINIYCDGGCAGNQSEENIGGWGAVLVYGKHIKELMGHAINTTNNKMELTALLVGLQAIKDFKHPVSVYSDSAYIVNCFRQKWYLGWLKNNWLNSKKQPVENRALWEQIFDLVKRHPAVHFYKVKGHIDVDDTAAIKKWHAKFIKDYGIEMPFEQYKTGIIYNNRADALANAAMDELR